MNIAPTNIVSIAPIEIGTMQVAFKPDPEAREEVCPVIGWATVVNSMGTRGADTEVKPAFLWGGQVLTEYDLVEHAPGFVGYDLRFPPNPLV